LGRGRGLAGGRREDKRGDWDEYDQSAFYTCMKYHAETHYFL
jgi:hypothetical protein